VRQLRAFDPEVILSGHFTPYRPTPEVWRMLESAAVAFDDVHRAVMPLEDDGIHFGADSQAAKLQPYHLHIRAPQQTAPLHGWVLNPFNRPALAEIHFVTPPAGWSAPPVRLPLRPREKHVFASTLNVAPGTHCARQPIALDLTVDAHPFGQVAEAWVTVD
jgi:hypothetical protein